MKTLNILCNECNVSFVKQKNEYDRQIRKGNNNFYCSLKCSGIHATKYRIKHVEIERECLLCKNKFISTTHKKHKKCCNKLCAKKYAQSFVKYDENQKDKLSSSMKRYYQYNSHIRPKTYEDRKCVICKTIFNIQKCKRKKTCSDGCLKKLMSVNSTKNPNCGGETNYKKYKYNDIWMDSTWEVNIAIWLDNNNIKWIRDRKINFIWTDMSGRKRRYYPDFYLPEHNLYLDPKNKYKLEKDRYKLSKVISENRITLIYGLQENIICELKNCISKKQTYSDIESAGMM